MVIDGGRHAMVTNGEIYNYQLLRAELEQQGERFSSESDTEVLLKACARWGVLKTLERANGMFAFAYWDEAQSQLWLARDRFGEKPLYWSHVNGSIAFASELKALRAVPDFDSSIDTAALAEFMKFNCVPAPATIYAGAHKLRAGTALRFRIDRSAPIQLPPDEFVYFDAIDEAVSARNVPFVGSAADAAEAVEAALKASVELRMIADVPLGAFLSGGIDSSLVVAMMSQLGSKPVKTFTIGFTDPKMNEAPHAREVAAHLGTDHVEMILSPADMLAVVPSLAQIYSEPFADSSQVPTYLVSKLARQHVTVSLSGDAGDELFGGYNRYFLAAGARQRAARLPQSLTRASAKAMRMISPRSWDLLALPANKLMGSRKVGGEVGDKVHKFAGVLAARTDDEVYDTLLSSWHDPVVSGRALPGTVQLPTSAGLSFTERMMLSDTVGYLESDILTKVDRAAMAVALESRVPMLDPDLYRLAWSLPQHYKSAAGKGKLVLRDVLARHVPRDMFERPKMGFAVPLNSWLRAELRDWAEDLLSADNLNRTGYLDAHVVRARWGEHVSGRRNWQPQLWNVLMFQSWLASHEQSLSAVGQS